MNTDNNYGYLRTLLKIRIESNRGERAMEWMLALVDGQLRDSRSGGRALVQDMKLGHYTKTRFTKIPDRLRKQLLLEYHHCLYPEIYQRYTALPPG